MTRPVFSIFLLVFAVKVFAQNPHGADLKINCAACHTSAGWEISAKFWRDFDPAKPKVSQVTGWVMEYDTLRFHHGKTRFELTGRHQQVDCRQCHSSLVFSEAKSECLSCHADMHQQTLGTDCARCHTTNDWLVDRIPELHQQNGFPLTGVHQNLDCAQCHHSASNLQFERIGNDCVDCHLQDFNATTNPDHKKAGFSTDCQTCHDPFTSGWGTDKVQHDFFPLTKGHAITDCTKCHSTGYTGTPANCSACHMPDYQGTMAPSHTAANFTTDCASCHTTDPGWTPANYAQHDAEYFPIYSGKHQGQWTQCIDCHQNPSNFAEFSCTNCHINPETNQAHTGVNGYAYENSACLVCHPNGDAGDNFDHSSTGFPLTGAHQTTGCTECHTNGYAGTPTQCVACHQQDFNQSLNPNHPAIGIPTDCAMCHTTDPGWAPATFPIHNNYYALNGTHATIANDCAACHNGNYNNTPNTCVGCHQSDYNGAANPNHQSQQFPTDCAQCHSETAWQPSTFNHNSVYPLNGAHAVIADDCNACHHGNYTNTPNTCAGCHQTDYNGTSNPNHTAANFPLDCAICHNETAWAPSGFDHNAIYPFTGAHIAIANDCDACHHGDYQNTPNTCAGCHTTDYNASLNPNHQALVIPMDCAMCHTTDPGWAPATFPIHNQYYALNGAHAAVASDCNTCHHGDYNNTPNTCKACHQADYNGTTNPNHQSLQFPTDCAQCHNESVWTPSTFDHSAVYPFTGAHVPVADDCNACHHGDYQNTPNTCEGCHTQDYNASLNPKHQALGIPTNCAMCHTTAPGWAPATFPIHNNYYVLNGAHATAANDCAACHNGDYNNTPNTCAACHQADYNGANNPNHVAAQFPTDCAQCHSETAWQPSTFNHNSFYPLNGAHAAIASDCNACHHGSYTNTPNTCVGCHQTDYNNTTNPNHIAAQCSTDCVQCHNETAWQPSNFDHGIYWPLNGAHAQIAGDCDACHHGNYNNTPNTCSGCHQSDYNNTTNPNHQVLQFPTDCAQCHNETAWQPSSFDHNSVYPLTGAHAQIASDCDACHHGNYTNTPNTCVACHQSDFNGSVNPNHQAIGIPTDCAMCHTTDPGWAPATFPIHNNYWPVNGAHSAFFDNCAACHNGDYTNTPNTCAGCHQSDYNATTNPNHVAAQFPTDCAQCHTESAWQPSTFDHSQYYPLNGAHAAIASDCNACHHGDYQNTPNTCVGCHQSDYDATSNPNHASVQFPTDCALCHTESAWSPSTFDHNQYYPFTGAHVAIASDCNACHHGDYQNTPNTCQGCHTQDYNASLNPNHQALVIPMDCAMCHTTEPGWAPASFPIHNQYYALNGAHAAIANDCATCHNGNYNNTPNTCVGCHQADYDATTNPNHASVQFPTDCALCHTETAWSPSTFDHNQYYPFTGAHVAIASDCNACHHGDYQNTPNTCQGCHTPDYNASLNPNHQALVLPMDCAMCHTTDAGWAPATFPIHNQYYALNGAHAAIANDCAACHNGDYNNTPNTCVGCHQSDYNGAQDPNHVSNQLPTTCQDCHSETAWIPSTFDHNAIYPFVGAHIAIADDCNACHHGNYQNTPNTCVGCHQSDYNSAQDPNHSANQLPTTCQDCHSETAWIPSTFDHNAIYPFTGAHIPIADDCNACHQGNYQNTPNTCVGCHQPDYNASLNPNHQALVIPTDCAMCHTTDPGWAPATFPIHNQYYPLNGAHAAIAADCATCHNGDYNNTPNTCVGCHQSDYNGAQDPNHTANQLPTTCQDCHSETAWIPSTFDHNAIYPFTGAHIPIADDCNACHHGNYTNTPNTCQGCHMPDYNGSTNPNHNALAIPTDCAMCHTTVADWMPATFPIHNQYYALNGAHAAIANDCAACHNGNYNNTPNTCYGCHQSDYNSAMNPNHSSNHLPTTCQDCHTETAWVPSTFDHGFYPLTGAHASLDCNDCHQGNYQNTPNTCVGCHQSDYNGSTNPNHQTLAIPTDCAMCHTTDPGWAPATFPIHNNYWPLNGAHANIADDCAACHNGNYNNTPNTCYGCHQSDYNGTNNPDHQSAGFPTTCQDCHTENAWVPSTFDHDQQYFPIYSGSHEGKWDQCVDCHTTSGNFALFSCINCHEHSNANAVAQDHQGVQGYQYTSTACYNCHPNGN